MKHVDSGAYEELKRRYKTPRKIIEALSLLKKKTRGSRKIPVVVLEDRENKILFMGLFSSDMKLINKNVTEVQKRIYEYIIDDILGNKRR
ncbi:MAG: hypothetical protein M0Z71_05160 [Nitrospiraceae bacterium]|nr:hypothetical protein [Nitrospiraceae bacterium]